MKQIEILSQNNSNNVSFNDAINKFQSKLFAGRSLTYKELRFAGNILQQSLKDNFNINGKVGQYPNQTRQN